LLRDREDIFDDYTEAAFEKNAEQRFAIGRREPLADCGRTLYLLEVR
jgi:hypothetical protein